MVLTRRVPPPLVLLVAWSVLAVCHACNAVDAERGGRAVILNRGSDTMINVAQGWAEAYAQVAPEVSVEVAGGGSGVGIAALIDGTVQIANSSRPLKPEEIAHATRAQGAAPVEIVAGYDALAVYVHRDNPMSALTLAQIQGIYAEQGAVTRWSDLGIDNRACPRD